MLKPCKGRENTYEFQWMDKKIPLTKKDDEGVHSTKKRSNNLFTTISGKKLLKERGGDIQGLVTEKCVEDEDREVPKEVQQLLDEFSQLSKN